MAWREPSGMDFRQKQRMRFQLRKKHKENMEEKIHKN